MNNTAAALIKIGDAHAECRSDIAPALRRLAEDPDWQLFEMLNGRGAGRRRADGLLRLHIARALDRWQVSHRIAAVAAQLELDWHEKWLWQNRAAPITLQTSTQER